MIRERPKLDLGRVQATSGYNRSRMNAYRRAVEDADQQARLKDCRCRVCFYVNTSRIGGSVCSSAECGLCDAVLSSGNTWIEALCRDCAAKHRLCRYCGGDLDDRQRRKL